MKHNPVFKSRPPRMEFSPSWVLAFFVLILLSLPALTGCGSWNPVGSFNPGSDGFSPPGMGAASAETQANNLYQDAWQTVFQEYVDPTHNGQDWYRWKDHYRGKMHSQDDAYVAIATMLASLNDDYTRFLPPRDMSEQSISIDSKLYGVGIQISVKENKLVVVTPIEGTPAFKAGIQSNDLITHINGEQTRGMSVENAADLIRGEEGTMVNLTIRRGDRTFDVNLPRAEIKIKSVFTKPLPQSKEIGYIRLNSFISESALKEMQEAMRAMADKRALILDLRGNYGGLLSNAVEISDMFLETGEIVAIVDRKQKRQVYNATPGQDYRRPMVVLIDGGSASASEILSGALKDNHRATLIGTRSFGKGLVQKINHLQDGSGINITISKYLTPNGTDINKKGIRPDIQVSFTEKDLISQRDPQLDAAVRFLQRRVAPASLVSQPAKRLDETR